MARAKKFWICFRCKQEFRRETRFQRLCPLCKEKKNSENKERWKGYVGQYKKLIEAIKNRDGNKCKICGATEENKTYEKLLLEVHHWDKNHNNSSWDNLITLCHGCHSRIHRYVYPDYKNH